MPLLLLRLALLVIVAMKNVLLLLLLLLLTLPMAEPTLVLTSPCHNSTIYHHQAAAPSVLPVQLDTYCRG